MRNQKLSCYFLPAALRRAAQRAFMASERLRRPAAVSPRFFAGALVVVPPPAFRLAAPRAFMDSESFLRPAAGSLLRRRPGAFGREAGGAAARFAQRAHDAAAKFAR